MTLPEPTTRTWKIGDKCRLPADHTGVIKSINNGIALVKRDKDGRERTYHFDNLSEFEELPVYQGEIGAQVITPDGDNREVVGLINEGTGVQVESKPGDIPGIGNPTYRADEVTTANHSFAINHYVVTPSKRLARVVALRGDEVHTMLRNGELSNHLYSELRAAESADFVREIDNLSAMLDAYKSQPIEQPAIQPEPAAPAKALQIEIVLNTTESVMEEKLASGWRITHMQFNEAGDLRCVFQFRPLPHQETSAVAKAERYIATLTEPAAEIITPVTEPASVRASLRQLMDQGYSALDASNILAAPAYQRAAINHQARMSGTAAYRPLGAH